MKDKATTHIYMTENTCKRSKTLNGMIILPETLQAILVQPR